MLLFGFFIYNWILVLLVLVFILFKWIAANNDHFLKKNVHHDRPIPFFGTYLNLFLRTDSQFTVLQKQYTKYKHKGYFGIFEHRKPILIISDPYLIRKILAVDYNHFLTNGGMFNSTTILEMTLDMMKGDKWNRVRSVLEPFFLSQNIRFMFYLAEECSEQAIQNLKTKMAEDSSIEVDSFDFLSRFFMDVLISSAIGMRSDTLSSKENILFNQLFAFPDNHLMYYLIHFMYGNFPWITKLLKMRLIGTSIISYFKSLVKDINEYRQKNKITHSDIIQFLMMQKDKINSNNNGTLSDEEIIIQTFVILVLGLVKCTFVASFAVIELAANPAVQRKFQREIDTTFNKLTGKTMSFDVLKTMDYANMIVYETIRKWPGEYIFDRVCTTAYTLNSDTTKHSVHIQPGDVICIPTGAMHWDPDYFSEPQKFDPERFSNERRGFIRPYTFVPFGMGLRNCLGAEIGMLYVKAALVSIFSEFDVEPVHENPGDVLVDNKAFYLNPRNKPIVRLTRRKYK